MIHVYITSADIVAKEGAVLDGSAVKLDGTVDRNHMTHDERYKNWSYRILRWCNS